MKVRTNSKGKIGRLKKLFDDIVRVSENREIEFVHARVNKKEKAALEKVLERVLYNIAEP